MIKHITSTLLVSIFLTACHLGHHRVKGNGNIKTENRSVSSFTEVDVSGNFDVYLNQDSSTSVRLEADENLMEYITIRTEGSTLVIDSKDDTNLSGSGDIKVYVSSPSFSKLDASGACQFISQDTITGNSLDIDLTGASDVNLNVNTPQVRTSLSGAGSVKLKGQTRDFSIDGSGSVSVKCMELLAENVTVEISGAGNAAVFASVKLDVRVSGAGDVKYRGNAVVTKNISGAGSVTKVE